MSIDSNRPKKKFFLAHMAPSENYIMDGVPLFVPRFSASVCKEKIITSIIDYFWQKESHKLLLT